MSGYGSGGVGDITTEWTTFTPSIVGITTSPNLATTHKKNASYKVVGKSLHIVWSYSHQFSTGATDGSGHYLIPIPGGNTVDVSKITIGSQEAGAAYGTPVGHGLVMQDDAVGQIAVVAHNEEYLKFIVTAAGSGYFTFVSSSFFQWAVNNKKLVFTVEVPIL